MRIKRLEVENVRSFLDKAELILDGKISIIIGPNGGGKTNLLDILVIMLRRYLYKSM
ncbi:TPA: AAA family ATPase, partial [Legionella pneumophila]|nr:AAA family ATPase [Legionella pneumophila]